MGETGTVVKVPLQPPLATTVPSHVVNLPSIAAWVWQAASLALTGQVRETTGAFTTVKIAEQVVVSGAQVLVYVQLTVVEPPQALGAVGLAGLVVSTPPHPPDAVAVASQAVNLASIAAWVWQAASLALTGQVRATTAGLATVKLAEQVVINGAQVLV